MDLSKQAILGYITAIIYDFFYVASTSAVQLLERRIPDLQLGMYRYISGVIVGAVPVLLSRNKSIKPSSLSMEDCRTVLYLGTLGTAMNFLLFFAAAFIPLSHMSFMLLGENITVAVVMKIFYDKVPNLISILAMAGCIIGSVLLIQPWMQFTDGFVPGFLGGGGQYENSTIATINQTIANHTTQVFPRSPPAASGLLAIGYLEVIGGGMLNALFSIEVNYNAKNIHPWLLFFLISCVTSTLSTVSCLYMEDPVWTVDPYVLMLIAVHITGLLGAGLLQIVACQLISPIQMSILTNLMTVIQLVAQYTINGKDLYGRKNVMEVVGCLMITICVALTAVFSEDKRHEDLLDEY